MRSELINSAGGMGNPRRGDRDPRRSLSALRSSRMIVYHAPHPTANCLNVVLTTMFDCLQELDE